MCCISLCLDVTPVRAGTLLLSSFCRLPVLTGTEACVGASVSGLTAGPSLSRVLTGPMVLLQCSL